MPWIEDNGSWCWYSNQRDLRLLLWHSGTTGYWIGTIYLAPCLPGIKLTFAAHNLEEAQGLLVDNYRGLLEDCALRRMELNADGVIPNQKTVWDHLLEDPFGDDS